MSNAANHEHNVAAMDAAGVPRGARRGFAVATGWNTSRIRDIERIESAFAGRASRWSVTVELYAGSYATHG
jgi:hypothetical protein